MTAAATPQAWRLREADDQLCVWRLDPSEPLPSWVWGSGDFVSVTRTGDELSIVCAADASDQVGDAVGPYAGFVVDQRLDFGLTGVLCGLLDPLAEAGISILALSTYDTDWILVPAERADLAVRQWRRRGHTVRRSPVRPSA